MHRGIGLDAFNELSLPSTKCRHALYECCCSVALAGDLAGNARQRARAMTRCSGAPTL